MLYWLTLDPPKALGKSDQPWHQPIVALLNPFVRYGVCSFDTLY